MVNYFSQYHHNHINRQVDTIEKLLHLILMEDSSKLNMQLNISIKMHQLLEYLEKMVYLLILLLTKYLGVVLAAEKKEFSKLFVPMRESGKLYKMDDHIMTSVSGVVADANYLIDYGRLHCQR